MQVSTNTYNVTFADDVLYLTQEFPSMVLSGQLLMQKKQIIARKHNAIYSPLNERLGGGEKVLKVDYSVVKSKYTISNISAGGVSSSYSSVRGTSVSSDNHNAYNQNALTTFAPFSLTRDAGSGRGDSGRGENGPATGQLLPLGDMFLPMLSMALVYVIFKFFHLFK
jgi:hypothetical protein